MNPKEHEEWRADVERRLVEGAETMRLLSDGLKTNTELTQQIANNTAGIVSLAQDLAAGTRFLCRLAMAVSWLMRMLRENWGVLLLIFIATAYLTNSESLLTFAFKLLKL